ncbi:MAG: sensor histidine kinase [Escherichia coli]
MLSIEVTGLREGDQCVFQITDDGIGLDDCAAKKLSQRMTSANFSDIHEIAIPNVNEQLKLLFGERGKITFEAHNLYGGDFSHHCAVLFYKGVNVRCHIQQSLWKMNPCCAPVLCAM